MRNKYIATGHDGSLVAIKVLSNVVSDMKNSRREPLYHFKRSVRRARPSRAAVQGEEKKTKASSVCCTAFLFPHYFKDHVKKKTPTKTRACEINMFTCSYVIWYLKNSGCTDWCQALRIRFIYLFIWHLQHYGHFIKTPLENILKLQRLTL